MDLEIIQRPLKRREIFRTAFMDIHLLEIPVVKELIMFSISLVLPIRFIEVNKVIISKVTIDTVIIN